MDESTIVTKQEQTEVVNLTPNSGDTTSSLSSLFDNMQKAKDDGRPVADAIKEQKEQKTEEKKVEPKAEEKKEEAKKEEPNNKAEKTEEKKDDHDDPREVLRKAMEERAEKKREEQEKKAEVKEEKKEDDVPEEELQVLPHDKPKTAKRIQALLKKIDSINSEVTKTKQEAQEKATKLADLEKKLSEVKTVNPETDEKIKQQLDELAMLRRRYELDNDPDVKSKFDSRVSSAEESIVSILKKRGATDALLNIIKEEGGWEGFSASNRSLKIPDKNTPGEMTTVTAAELADMVLEELPLPQRKAVEAAMLEQIQTRRDRERFFKEEQQKANEFFKKREEESAKSVKAQQEAMEAAKKTIDKWKEGVFSSDFIKDKEIPANAPADVAADVKAHNEYNNQLRALVNKNINVNSLDGILDVALDAVRYYDERRTTNSLRKEVEKLKAAILEKDNIIAKFKTGAKSTPKSGSIAASPASKETPKAARSLEEAFDMIAQGRKPDGSDSEDE